MAPEVIGLGAGQSLIAPAVLAAAGTFLGNQVLGWLRERRRARNFLKALYAEVCFNIDDLGQFIESYDPAAVEAALREKPDLIPHLADERHTDIYRKQIERIETLRDGEIRRLVTFYGSLEQIRSRIDSMQNASFRSISANGRIFVVGNIYDLSRRTRELGLTLIAELERDRIYVRRR
jgi:hypothetical protein